MKLMRLFIRWNLSLPVALNRHSACRSFHLETTDPVNLKTSYDVVVIGAGHNGLIAAAYLQKAGYTVCVLERRHVIGGAAVTEEIIPGFKFSRASYLLSLMRPYIITELKLKEHGLKFYMREPYSSYTPLTETLWSKFPSKSLLLSSDLKLTQKEISKFSVKDAKAYAKYEDEMRKYVMAINHLVDTRPSNFGDGSFTFRRLAEFGPVLKALRAIGTSLPGFQELLTAPASKILNKWFESEPLKATLVTDAVIGAMQGPHTPGNGYVLLHHVMGGVDGTAGAWAYAEGGMGGVSASISSSAQSLGVHVFTEMEVSKILYEKREDKGHATGVLTVSGKEIMAKRAVFSGTTPHVTFKHLLNSAQDITVQNILGAEFMQAINAIDYTSPVTKINVALNCIPNFSANPNLNKDEVNDWHKCSIHINSETMEKLRESFESCQKTGMPSKRPMIEMVIPSSLDPTLAPKGAHVCLLFTQYTPYSPAQGSWADPEFKEAYAMKVFDVIEEYAPGFKQSIIGKEVLSPWDLEKIFNLTGGNIFHGAIGLEQIYFLRPILTNKCRFPETPLIGLYLCGSGSHPGGGVMGVPGVIAAKAFINR